MNSNKFNKKTLEKLKIRKEIFDNKILCKNKNEKCLVNRIVARS
jgi:hypothetical protein